MEENRWKLLLEELGMSQVRFAERVGVGKSERQRTHAVRGGAEIRGQPPVA